jgi:saccharopine dehydrogenase (NAD+, L-lysine-forming)
MGRAVVHELHRSGRRVLILDRDLAAARRVGARYAEGAAEVGRSDVQDLERLARSLRGAAVVVNCAPYRLNLSVMDAALLAGCHYVDLGGLFHMTRRQLRRGPEFQRAGLLAVLGMGSAPGLTNLFARAAADTLVRVRAIRIYNGGGSPDPDPDPLAFGFSPATVLDELTEPPVVFARGRFRAAPPLSGGEDVRFALGTQHVSLSLHSEVATLPLAYRRKGVRECFFKVSHDPRQLELLRAFVELGLADPRPGRLDVAPRDLLVDLLQRRSARAGGASDSDRDDLLVVVEGEDERGPVTVRTEMVARAQRRPPLSGVARDTGFPAAIVAGLVADGLIAARGVHAPEACVPVAPVLAALARRGMGTRTTRRRH